MTKEQNINGLYDQGGELALLEISRRKPALKSHMPVAVEQAVVVRSSSRPRGADCPPHDDRGYHEGTISAVLEFEEGRLRHHLSNLTKNPATCHQYQTNSEGGMMFENEAFRNVWAPRLLSLVRIILGLLYMQHGLSKYFGFPAAAPQNFQVFSLFGLAGAIEIIGGLMLAIGLYTRWVAFIMSGEMAVAFFIVRHRLSISFFPLRSGGQLEAVYSIFFFTFFLIGGGSWSIDWLRRNPQSNAPQ